MDINKYDKLIAKETSFHISLELILKNLKSDLISYNFNSGFIAYLNGEKIDNRFKILCSNGRFLNRNNMNIITSKEIDNLSIVYMTKNNVFKSNFFIDIIEKEYKDVFIYLEFDKILDKIQKKLINDFFKKLNALIKNKKWELI